MYNVSGEKYNDNITSSGVNILVGQITFASSSCEHKIQASRLQIVAALSFTPLSKIYFSIYLNFARMVCSELICM